MRSHIQAAEMTFLQSVDGINFRETVRSSVFNKGLRVEWERPTWGGPRPEPGHAGEITSADGPA